jgi:hypothetical protein
LVTDLLSFTQNLMQTHCCHFATHRAQSETWSQKSTSVKTICVHRVASCGRLMQKYWGSVTLASPLFFFHQGSYNSNSLGTFRYTSYFSL